MKRNQLWAAVALTSASIAMSTQASAGQDFLYPSESTPGISNQFNKGAPGHLNLGPQAPDTLIVIEVTWTIDDNSPRGGTNTGYPTAVQFKAIADAAIGPVTIDTPSCALSSAASICKRTISFKTPTAPGSYSVNIHGSDFVRGDGSKNGIIAKQVTINFSVASQAKIPTITEAGAALCAYLNGSVNLPGILTSAIAPMPGIGAKPMGFALGTLPMSPDSRGSMQAVGTEQTVAPSGQAVLGGVSLVGRGVGDYQVLAQFAGDTMYDASQDTTTLGIQYRFLGFQPPISADATLTWNGRNLPIQIKISDALGNPVTTAAPTVWMTSIGGTPLASGSGAVIDNQMRYSPKDDSYIFNWDTSAYAPGTYAIWVDLGSAACASASQMATIALGKKK